MRQTALQRSLSELKQDQTPSARNRLLQSLKNELIGHRLRKKIAVDGGIIPLLSGILLFREIPRGKDVAQQNSGYNTLDFDSETLSQVTAIVTVLADGRWIVNIESVMRCR